MLSVSSSDPLNGGASAENAETLNAAAVATLSIVLFMCSSWFDFFPEIYRMLRIPERVVPPMTPTA